MKQMSYMITVFWVSLVLACMLGACGKEYTTLSIKGDKGDTGAAGAPGEQGVPGLNGANGHNAVASSVNVAPGAICPAGGFTMLVGTDLNDNNVLDATEIMASNTLCNGQNGTNGTDAPPTPFTPVAILNPCGNAPGVYDEIFIVLQNGMVLASFSQNTSGLNTRFVNVLESGGLSGVTTDGDNCVFTINSSGAFTYQSHMYP